MDESYLTREQLAKRWNLKVSTLDQWRWNGKGPIYFKIGKVVYYWPHDIQNFEMSQRRHSTTGLFLNSIKELEGQELNLTKNHNNLLSVPNRRRVY